MFLLLAKAPNQPPKWNPTPHLLSSHGMQHTAHHVSTAYVSGDTSLRPRQCRLNGLRKGYFLEAGKIIDIIRRFHLAPFHVGLTVIKGGQWWRRIGSPFCSFLCEVNLVGESMCILICMYACGEWCAYLSPCEG